MEIGLTKYPKRFNILTDRVDSSLGVSQSVCRVPVGDVPTYGVTSCHYCVPPSLPYCYSYHLVRIMEATQEGSQNAAEEIIRYAAVIVCCEKQRIIKMQAFRKAAQRFGWKQQADGERMSGITANWPSINSCSQHWLILLLLQPGQTITLIRCSSSQRRSLFRETFSRPTPQVSAQGFFFLFAK